MILIYFLIPNLFWTEGQYTLSNIVQDVPVYFMFLFCFYIFFIYVIFIHIFFKTRISLDYFYIFIPMF